MEERRPVVDSWPRLKDDSEVRPAGSELGTDDAKSVLRNMLKNMNISAHSARLIPRIRYYEVTHMGQKKELLGYMQKSLRNPCNRLASPSLERVEKKFFGAPGRDAQTLTLLTGSPQSFGPRRN